jgi:hypothetical protein
MDPANATGEPPNVDFQLLLDPVDRVDPANATHKPPNGHRSSPPERDGIAPTAMTDSFLRAAELQARPVEWLMRDRIPAGEITVLEGDPSGGKSTLVLDLAARVSAGRPMPDGTETVPGHVVLVLGEDSLEKTVVPRLEAAGADRGRVLCTEGHDLVIPRTLGRLERAVFGVWARLVVIDPLMAFLGPNANGDQAVRQALTPLRRLAEASGAAIVLVRHLNKSGRGSPLYRGSGSIAILGAARSVLLVGKSPDDPGLGVLCSSKNNLGPRASGLLFELTDTGSGAARIEWRGECDYEPEDLLGAQGRSGPGKLDEARRWLGQLLRGGPRPQAEIERLARLQGFSWRTVERAKRGLNVRSTRDGFGPGSKVSWALSDPTAEGVVLPN